MPIGTKVRYLNQDYAYEEGTKNQLDKWKENGFLKGYNKEEKKETIEEIVISKFKPLIGKSDKELVKQFSLEFINPKDSSLCSE